MAAAASSLQTQAGDLVQTVAVFKLNANDGHRGMALATAAVRSHKPGALAFKGTDQRSAGISKGAAAKSAPTPAKKSAAPATLSMPKVANQKATAGPDADWETF